MKLKIKLLIIIIFVFLTLFTSTEYIRYRSIKNEVVNNLLREAKNIRSVLMATRRVYHHQFLESGIPLTDKTIGFLPAHSLSRISEDFKNWTESELYFNNVSDRPRNPRNRADPLEMKALNYFRENSTEKERFVSFKSEEDELFYHYSAPIWVEKYCLKCHGKREDAPTTIRTRYANAFNYKVGELRGVMSIKLPATQLKALVWANFQRDLWVHLACFAGMFFLVSWLLRRYVTNPVSKLTLGLEEVAGGNFEYPIEELSGEMSIVGKAFNRMSGQLGQRESELRESEERYRDLFENANDLIQSITPDGHFVYVNRSWRETLGYTKEEVLKLTLFDIIHPDSHLHYMETFVNVISGEKVERVETVFVSKSGKNIIVDGSVNCCFKEGKPVSTRGIFRDITERKRADKEIKESEEKYRRLIENLRDNYFFYVHNTEGVFTYISPSVANVLGYSPEEFLTHYSEYLTDNPINKELMEHTELSIKGIKQTPYEAEIYHKDGTIRSLQVQETPIFNDNRKVVAVEGIAQDITERKQAEEALQESEKKYSSLIANIPSVTWITNSKGETTFVSPNVKEIYGYTPEEIHEAGESLWFGRIHPDDVEMVKETYGCLFKKTSQFDVEYRIKRKDGEWIWLHDRAVTTYKKGGIQFAYGVFSDITERKQTEEALKKSEQQFRTLVSNIPGIVYRCENDEHWTMKYISNSIEDLTGYSASDFIGNKVRSITSIIHHNDREMVDRIVQEGVRNKQPFVIEYRIVSKDGSIRHVNEKGQGAFNKEGELLWVDGTVFDITEQKEMEDEIVKIQKLESIGILAGGIAHDFNNSLQVIMGYITMAEIRTNPDDEIKEYLNEANKAILHSKSLTQQLLTFSKGGEPVKNTLFISKLIRNSVKLALSGSNIRCEFSIPDDLWPVKADKGQLNQVISNLIINADQAMPGGGNIRIKAENINVNKRVSSLPLKEKRYVKITIKDHGTGISQKYLQNIFDPYFTTKQNGSGLGLATTYSIVKKHDGHITVESEIGIGTTFHIYLPASRKRIQKKSVLSKAEEACPEPVKGKGASGALKGKVLLMDDEHVIRTVLSKHLRHLKYEVETAKEGAEAIGLYKRAMESGKSFDAVIMDITITGGMGGKEAIKRLCETDPEARAIVMSGYANDPIMANYKKYGFSGVLPKPHEIHELDEALQKVMKRM